METLCKIRDVYRAIEQYEVEFETQHSLSLNEGMLLCCISKHERISSGEIAAQIGLTVSNTSKVIKSIESKGFIERELGEVDKRQMYFVLTDAGREKLHSIHDICISIPNMLEPILKD